MFLDICVDGQLTSGRDLFARVTTRGGKQVIAEFKNMTEESYFERRIDETSISEVTIMIDPTCCDGLGDITIGFELEWWRDGSIAWVGSIDYVRWAFDSFYLQASDLTSWWAKRIAPTLSFNAVDASLILRKLHEVAMQEDPVPNLQLLLQESGQPVTIDSFLNEYEYISDIIAELADTALDYTAYGRSILVGPSDFLPELPFFLTDKDWLSPPTVEARGPATGFATRIYAVGPNDEIAIATASDRTLQMYGLIERVVQFDTLSLKEDLRRAAKTYLDIYSTPYYINFDAADPVLKPGAIIPFEALIPGIRVGLQSTATCRSLQMVMRLANMRCMANGSVSISLEPTGTTEFGTFDLRS